MKKKILSMLLLMSLTTGMLAGCGNTNTETEQKSSEQSKSSESVSSEESASSDNTEEVVEEKVKMTPEEAAANEYCTYAPGIKGEEGYLESLGFGPDGTWKIHTESYLGHPSYRRYDGLEFTFVTTTGGGTLPEGQTVDDNERIWEFELKYGLDPKCLWYADGDGFDQKKKAAIASGDIPDLMFVNASEYNMLIKQGLLEDITDLVLWGDHPRLQELMESTDGIAEELITVDGRIYGIPCLQNAYGSNPMIWIRTDWLDQLGLEEPKSYADLEDIALAFMAADFDGNGKDDSYGIPVLAEYDTTQGEDGDLGVFFANVGKGTPGIWSQDGDGNLIWGSLMTENIESLEVLNDWYNKGIIPSDFATWDRETMKQAYSDNKSGIAIGVPTCALDLLAPNIALNSEAEWNAYMLPGEEGEDVMAIAGDAFTQIAVIKKGYVCPDALITMVENTGNVDFYRFGEDTSGKYNGVEYEVSNAYSPVDANVSVFDYYLMSRDWIDKIISGELTTRDEVMEYTKGLTGASPYRDMRFIYEIYQTGESVRGNTYKENTEDFTYEYFLANYVGLYLLATEEYYPVSNIYLGTTESMEMYSNFLDEFEMTEYTKMIMGDTGGKTIEEYFGEFVEAYLKQGGAAVLEEVKEAIGE